MYVYIYTHRITLYTTYSAHLKLFDVVILIILDGAKIMHILDL